MAEKNPHTKEIDEGYGKTISVTGSPVYGRGEISGQIRLPTKITFLVSNTSRDLLGKLFLAIRWEHEQGLAFNLLPVFFAVGIGTYFISPSEPLMTALIITAVAFVFWAYRIKYHGALFYCVAALAAISSGMLAAKMSTQRAEAPQIERQMTGAVRGVILSADQNRRGSPRLILRPFHIDGLENSELPRRIRLSSANRNLSFRVGEQAQGLARIQPVAGPVFPGSYDFSFHGWFSGQGGSGFFMGAPEIVPAEESLTVREYAVVMINRVREAIKQRIAKALPEEQGDIAIALISGDKSRIPEQVQQNLRNTGLAHILAISGLHMALITLTIIWIVRFGASFFPKVVLHYPVKKWAVCAGFAGATLYLLLSGAGIATQRAWIMISVMLLAVLLDKRAITMRSVAVSATIILLFSPESLFAPGFQMSFAAVAALVAGYEFLSKRKRTQDESVFQPVKSGWIRNMSGGLFGYVSGLATTSLIAGTATAFVAAWHFHQIAPFGLLANVMAMPIIGFLIMPFALFSMLLMPYGLESIALWPVAFGITQVIAIADWVNDISPSGVSGILPSYSLLIFGIALSILTLSKSRLRLLSAVPIVILFPLMKSQEQPQIFVSENGRAIAIEDKAGELALLYPRRNAFVTGIWSKAWSNGKIKKLKLPKDQCNSERCIVVLPSSHVLHVVYDPKLLKSSCNRADILVAPRLWWVNCRDREPQLVLKRYDFEQKGSHALYIEPSGSTEESRGKITIKTGLKNSTRPWVRNVRPIDEVSDIGGADQPVSLALSHDPK
ncbi:MAG: ComEC/Rec2 family competence protein [Rhizobiaceae bacterium]